MSKRKGWHKGRKVAQRGSPLGDSTSPHNGAVRAVPPRAMEVRTLVPTGHFDAHRMQQMGRLQDHIALEYRSELHFVAIAEMLSRSLDYRVEEYQIFVRVCKDDPVHVRMTWRRDGNNTIG